MNNQLRVARASWPGAGCADRLDRRQPV